MRHCAGDLGLPSPTMGVPLTGFDSSSSAPPAKNPPSPVTSLRDSSLLMSSQLWESLGQEGGGGGVRGVGGVWEDQGSSSCCIFREAGPGLSSLLLQGVSNYHSHCSVDHSAELGLGY